jgi:aminoglycoside/choline kinase family phosphotransferase
MLQAIDRAETITDFLEVAGLHAAKRTVLAQDASNRKYERVMHQGKSYILMDAPPDKEPVRPFMQITHYLRHAELSAPEIIAADEHAGLLLLEDLGEASFTKLLNDHPEQETALYREAAGVLLKLWEGGHPAELLKLDPPHYSEGLLMQEVRLFADWFLLHILPAHEAEAKAYQFIRLWEQILEEAAMEDSVLVHRDYHADNLFWLPTREGIDRVGLLDYQDAVMGTPAYDLVSLLEDARRDVSPETVEKTLDMVMTETGADKQQFLKDYSVLGAQRNCKIIGIFTRLAVRDNKPHYLDYLPRVWQHLKRDLEHPALAEMKAFIDDTVADSFRGVLDISEPKVAEA